MEKIIEVKNLTKKYGDFTAVDNISFDVLEGETFGILGPNGAGKTTTLEMLEGLKGITAGQAFVAGLDVAAQAKKVKAVIGTQLQSSSFFDGLNLKELLETFAALYNRKIDALQILESVQLLEKSKSRVKELSGGQKQRLSIAAALVNDPKILFLDEPTTGLDPQARRNLWELVENIKRQGKTIVLTTHYMEEAEVLCDRIAIMDRAKIVAMDTTKNLLQMAGNDANIDFRTGFGIRHEVFAGLPGLIKLEGSESEWQIVSNDPQATLASLFNWSRENNVNIFDLRLRQATMEDVFLKLTGHDLRE
ncbi:MAG: ABC transporter ATP-binding protein [Candidatus Doudnabacteria bacterium]|nr:ABC transporter ATP-binding protein [Candidatus Doudnabacteria bacterium]